MWWKYFVFTFENKAMKPAEIFLRWEGKRRDKMEE
jgi:hypothetical protein